ncbi:MAG: hypothetical protein AB1512_20345 [Thermodesulfobacteriota bacterium]
MRKLWIVLMALAGLLLLPSGGNPQTEEGDTTGIPQMALALVREGDFAVRLAEALGLGVFQYAWVPYRFRHNGYLFTGFFCLNDFDRVVIGKHGRKFVTSRGFYHRAASRNRHDVRPSPLRGSFSRPALPERTLPPPAQPRSRGRGFDRDKSFDRPHGGGSGRGGFFRDSWRGGSGRSDLWKGSGRSGPACRAKC